MLTCGMEHFVDDEDIKGMSQQQQQQQHTSPSLPTHPHPCPGKRASDVSADDAAMASEAVRRSNFLPTSHRIR